MLTGDPVAVRVESVRVLAWSALTDEEPLGLGLRREVVTVIAAIGTRALARLLTGFSLVLRLVLALLRAGQRLDVDGRVGDADRGDAQSGHNRGTTTAESGEDHRGAPFQSRRYPRPSRLTHPLGR